jgi:hypothetical protein
MEIFTVFLRLTESSSVKAGNGDRHHMVIWRDKKRGTKVFRLPRTYEEQPAYIEGIRDDGSDEIAFVRLMNSRHCYDLMPNGSKLVIFDTELTLLAQGWYILVWQWLRRKYSW